MLNSDSAGVETSLKVIDNLLQLRPRSSVSTVTLMECHSDKNADVAEGEPVEGSDIDIAYCRSEAHLYRPPRRLQEKRRQLNTAESRALDIKFQCQYIFGGV